MSVRLWLILLLMCLITPQPQAVAARYQLDFGGDFTLSDHNGKPFSLTDAHGKVVLIFFGFTSCGHICPTTMFKAASAIRQLGPLAEQVQPLFISVDTKRDTPEVLGKYVASFHPSLIGLTGTQEEVEAVADQYRTPVLVRKPNEDGFYVVDHGSRLFLVDPEGILANIIIFEETPEQIAKKIRELLE